MNRNIKISNLRIFAIVSVVIGHSIIIYSDKWRLMPTSVSSPFLDCLKNVINFYQMELYFIISGYLMFGSVCKRVKVLDFIKKKAYRLLIPYFVIGLFWMIPIKLFLDVPFYHLVPISNILLYFIIGTSNGHLWFLYTLFFIFCLLYPINIFFSKIEGGGLIVLCGSIILLYLSQFFSYDFFNFNYVLQFAYWFQLGYILRLYKRTVISAVLLFCILLFYYICIKCLISLLIIFLLYLIIPAKTNGFLNEIDKNSFGIYLFHSPLVYITFTYFPNKDPFLVVLINLFMGYVAYYISKCVKHLKILRI